MSIFVNVCGSTPWPYITNGMSAGPAPHTESSCPEQHRRRVLELREPGRGPSAAACGSLPVRAWPVGTQPGRLVSGSYSEWLAFALGICCLSHLISQHVPSFKKKHTNIKNEWNLLLIRVPGWFLLRPPQVCYKGSRKESADLVTDWMSWQEWVRPLCFCLQFWSDRIHRPSLRRPEVFVESTSVFLSLLLSPTLPRTLQAPLSSGESLQGLREQGVSEPLGRV